MIYGIDFSSLEETESLGGVFYEDGHEAELLDIFTRRGVTAARLRVWVNPFSADGRPYGAGVCDVETACRLAVRAKKAGMSLLLDFHYSDFWADPARQLIPREWRGMDYDALREAVYKHTADVLKRFIALGVEPQAVQVGNEITNGMMWPVGRVEDVSDGSVRPGYDRLAGLLKEGVRAVRELTDAKVMLHLENSGNNPLWREWLDEITARGVDFDLLGASYYPFWHGTIDQLSANLADVYDRYGKEIFVVETAYPFTSECCPGTDVPPALGGEGSDPNAAPPPFPYTPEGQKQFLDALVAAMKKLPGVKGIYYWEPGWLAVKGSTWATPAAIEYINEPEKTLGNEWANQCLFDYEGRLLPAAESFV